MAVTYLPNEIPNNYFVIDVEGDPIPSTKLWVIIIKHLLSGQYIKFGGPDNFRNGFRKWVEANPTAVFIGHNILSYDIPTLNRLCGTSIPYTRCIDTLVLSYLYYPQLPSPEGFKDGGPHSLAAYGYRFKYPKSTFNDFSQFSQELMDRCVIDVDITDRVYRNLLTKMRKVGFSEKSCELEHKIRVIVDEQQARGFHFDVEAASKLYAELRAKERELESVIHKLFPPRLVVQATFQKRWTKGGEKFASWRKHELAYPQIVERDLEYDVYDYEEFNIGSPAQRVDRLLELGFVPTKFTEKGNPKVDEETLIEFANECKREEVYGIAEWLVANGRANMINTWLNAYNDNTQAIHGRVMTCGAGSRRMTHSNPNTANIPSNEAKYGKECRGLWRPRPGLVLVGYDAAAAQMRVFAHYLPDPEQGRKYYDKGVCKDPHQLNADLIGVTRKIVKNVFYANMFGAGHAKLAATAKYTGKGPVKYGRWIQSELYRTTPGLEEATLSAQSEFEATPEHWIKCVDGGFVRCPAANAALNYRIQSGEACLMKQASIFIHERTLAEGIEDYKVGDIHDEGQHECRPNSVSDLKRIMVQSLRDAGEELGFRVPMDGDAREGLSWAETH